MSSYRLALVLLSLFTTSSTRAFVVPLATSGERINKGSAALFAHSPNQHSWTRHLNQAVVSALVAGSVWTSSLGNPVDLALHRDDIAQVTVAYAKEKASGTGSRVNKDPESLLRYGLPIPKSKEEKEMRKLQGSIEDIKLDIGSKRKNAALEGVKKSRTILNQQKGNFASTCREPKVCSATLEKMSSEQLDDLESAVRDSLNAFQGSEQERAALDEAYVAQKGLTQGLSVVEQQMIPKGYTTPVPSDYKDLPQLQGGRATVEMTVVKPDKSPFTVNGQNIPTAKMTMIIDGYTSPITGGNFVDLVQRGFYNNMVISRSDGFVVQTGDPEGEAEGFVGGTPSASIGAGDHGERLIPLEITVKGDSGPFYESTIEDEGRGGEATVLPFSSYGAMGWARDEYDVNSGSSQFFWLLFDSDLTPAGKNVLDGRYPWYVLTCCVCPLAFVLLPACSTRV